MKKRSKKQAAAIRNIFTFFENRAAIVENIKSVFNALKYSLSPISLEIYESMITKHTDGDKMDGMLSLSTCPTLNLLCVMRSHVSSLICSHCYSMTMNKRFKNLRKKLERNTYYLTESIIPYDCIPFLNCALFRLESFGDLQNVTQAINYLNLIKKNNHVKFAWWTKNPIFIKEALQALNIEKPENVQIIFSSPCMNHPINIEALKKAFPFIDKVFTVFDKEHAASVKINCGNKQCRICQNCYHATGDSIVNEIVK